MRMLKENIHEMQSTFSALFTSLISSIFNFDLEKKTVIPSA